MDRNDIITCDQDEFFGCPRVPSDAAVIDFIGIMRKLTSINRKDVNTFGDLCNLFLRSVFSYSKMSKEIHVIMENYKPLSIKSAERQRRQLNNVQLCQVIADKQPLPDLKDF